MSRVPRASLSLSSKNNAEILRFTPAIPTVGEPAVVAAVAEPVVEAPVAVVKETAGSHGGRAMCNGTGRHRSHLRI